jgi:hypothetical protein
MPQNYIKNESGDAKYFVMILRLVWALCRSPYDFILWSVIKDIAGERGECYVGTRNLAKLCRMSVGKVAESREYIISQGLLTGEVRKDKMTSRDAWHITIPDLWLASTRWAETHLSMASRLEWVDRMTSEQSGEHVEQTEYIEHCVHPMNAEDDCVHPMNAEDDCVHPMNAEGQKEGVRSPGDDVRSPGDTKEEHKEQPSYNPKKSGAPKEIWEAAVLALNLNRFNGVVAKSVQNGTLYLEGMSDRSMEFLQENGPNIQKTIITLFPEITTVVFKKLPFEF